MTVLTVFCSSRSGCRSSLKRFKIQRKTRDCRIIQPIVKTYNCLSKWANLIGQLDVCETRIGCVVLWDTLYSDALWTIEGGNLHPPHNTTVPLCKINTASCDGWVGPVDSQIFVILNVQIESMRYVGHWTGISHLNSWFPHFRHWQISLTFPVSYFHFPVFFPCLS